MTGVRDSQRAWVGHGVHDDSPPRRLVRPEYPDFEGKAFQEDTRMEDDWRYDDPSIDWGPGGEGPDVFDSRDLVAGAERGPWRDGPWWFR